MIDICEANGIVIIEMTEFVVKTYMIRLLSILWYWKICNVGDTQQYLCPITEDYYRMIIV